MLKQRFSVKRHAARESKTLLMISKKSATNERDARVMRLYERVVEIEQRLIPTGLHVFGRPSELQEKTDLLRMIASFDRPEHGRTGCRAL